MLEFERAFLRLGINHAPASIWVASSCFFPLFDDLIVILASLLVFIHYVGVALLLLQGIADSIQVGRIESLPFGLELLFLQSFDLFAAPLLLSPLHHLLLHFAFFLSRLDINLLHLELDSAEFDNIVLFERVLLFNIAVSNITNNEKDLLKCITRVL